MGQPQMKGGSRAGLNHTIMVQSPVSGSEGDPSAPITPRQPCSRFQGKERQLFLSQMQCSPSPHSSDDSGLRPWADPVEEQPHGGRPVTASQAPVPAASLPLGAHAAGEALGIFIDGPAGSRVAPSGQLPARPQGQMFTEIEDAHPPARPRPCLPATLSLVSSTPGTRAHEGAWMSR